MSAKRSQPPPPWFRLRCALVFCLAAGVWSGVWMAGRASIATSASDSPAQSAGKTPGSPPVATTPKEAAKPQHAGPAIVIDPGHGGKDPGKPAGEQLEKSWTLRVSLELAEELRSRGWPVELTRTDDATLLLTERSDFANRAPRRAFVSIHFNSGGPEAAGMEVYFAWPKLPETMVRLEGELGAPAGTSVLDERSRLLAESLQSAATQATGSRNRGVKNDPGLAVLNRTVCPSVLVECGFLTNAVESLNIQSEAWRRKLVTGLADGLESWLQAARAPGYGITFEPAGASDAVPVSAPAQ